MKILLALLLLPGGLLAADAKLNVAVANYPLKYFAERLGGERVNVIFPVPSHRDPAFWKPNDQQIASYQKAGLILMNGATYSKWADKATLPKSRMVDTSASFKDKYIVIENATSHSHGPGGTHSHAGTSFTTWIDFQQAIAQAQAVQDALIKKLPDAKEEIAKSFAVLRTDLEALDSRLVVVGKKLAKRPLMVSHPVYHYLARRYDLNIKDVLWEPEVAPNDKQMAELKKILAAHPAKWMIWEGEPSPESVEDIKSVGLQSAVFSPCGNTPESGDWLSVMQANVANLEQVAGS